MDKEVSCSCPRLNNWHKQLTAPQIGMVKQRLVRDYNRESSLGNFVADVLREVGKADIGIQNAGGLRADLPAGQVTNGNVYDALPLVNSLVVCEVTGKQLKEILEQGFSLERGMVQVSGLMAKYDLSKPPGARLVSLTIGGQAANDDKVYRVATNSFIAQGGDLYQTFLQTKQTDAGGLLSEIVMTYLREKKFIQNLPTAGRLLPVN